MGAERPRSLREWQLTNLPESLAVPSWRPVVGPTRLREMGIWSPARRGSSLGGGVGEAVSRRGFVEGVSWKWSHGELSVRCLG
jgi:hypothetical protein